MPNSDAMLVLFSASDLVVDAHGPDPIVVQFGDALHADVADEPLVLQFAAVGLPGRDGADGAATPVEAVAAANLAAGMPVAIDRTSGQLVAADAAFKPRAFVAGLLAAAVTSGFVGSAMTDRLMLTDWSAATGATQLAVGLPYFLAAGGGLTTTPPASACITIVGKAISPTTMLINPQPPIQL
jgi:hypothetical protein